MKEMKERENIKQEGRQEVIDWIEKNSQPIYINSSSPSSLVSAISNREWEKQKEKWSK